MIGLLDRPDTGVLRIAGQDTAQMNDEEVAGLRSETIGFVFQQFHLLKRMTAFDNVELPLIYAKGDASSANPAGAARSCGPRQSQPSQAERTFRRPAAARGDRTRARAPAAHGAGR